MTLLSEASFLVTPNGYKASKLYAAIPTNGDGDMTFTRATPATRVDENDLVSSVASNVPRIDYTGGGCPSILLEPQRTNLLTYSEQFDNAGWVKKGTSSVSGNTTIAPTGTLTADTLIGASDITWGTSNSIQKQPPTLSSSTTYTLSLYVKSLGSTTFETSIRNNNAGGQVTVSHIINSDTWTRVEQIYTTTPTQTVVGIIFGGTDGDVAIWGAQLELGAYPTSYIPTTTATVTRNADVINRDDIYTNNLITDAGGTWFVYLENNLPLTRDGGGNLFIDTVSSGFGNGWAIRNIAEPNARFRIVKYIASLPSVNYATTDTVKIAIKWNETTADVFVNGVKVVSATPFTTTNMQFLGGNGSDHPKYIKQMALFAKPLTDAECIALTTL
jgi:hypothetical protein